MAYVGVSLLRHLKQELTWATDERLRIISNTMLFKAIISLRNLRIKPF